ncbi:MAG: tyrosine-type recombinase/integrase [Bacteroidales bacterium]|nr:tyrosine-type recombinase/integrase [Bacteroidales bacterium]
MEEPHFVLRRKYVNKDGLTQLQLVYSSNNHQVRLDTGIRIRPKDWNDNKKQILSSVSEIEKDSKELNDLMIEKKKKVMTIVSDFKKAHDNGTSIAPDPDPKYVRENFNEVIKEINEERPLLEHLKTYIDDRKSYLDTVYDGLKKDKRSGQYKTLNHFEILYTDLVRFSEKNRKTYYFCDINKKFRDNLVKFYLTKGASKTSKKGLNNSTLKKKFSRLKSFLNVMTEDGVNKYLIYKTFSLKEFKVVESDDNIFALTIKEFEQFKNFPLMLEKLEIARDYYLLSCSSGLRWSDVSRLNKTKIKNDLITTNIIKTSQTLIIPLNPISESILKKYNYQMPEISKPEIDRRLTLMWLIMSDSIPSLKEQTLYKYYVGSAMIEEYYPKYQLLSFHTSRKYFITYLIYKGVPIDQIRKLSGHRGSLEVFFRYVYSGNMDPSLKNNLFTESDLWKS